MFFDVLKFKKKAKMNCLYTSYFFKITRVDLRKTNFGLIKQLKGFRKSFNRNLISFSCFDKKIFLRP